MPAAQPGHSRRAAAVPHRAGEQGERGGFAPRYFQPPAGADVCFGVLRAGALQALGRDVVGEGCGGDAAWLDPSKTRPLVVLMVLRDW